MATEFPSAVPVFPPPYGYVSLSPPLGTGVVVIDHLSHTVISTIATGSAGELEIAPLRTIMLVSSSSGKVQVVRPGKMPTLVGPITVGVYPRGIAFSRDGKFGYVVNGDNTVSIVDTAALVESGKIAVEDRPWGIVVTPDMKRAYVASLGAGSGEVSVIDLPAATIVKHIPVGRNPFRMAITPDGRYIYVTHETHSPDTPIVTLIDTTSDSVIATIPVGTAPGPYASDVAVTPDGKRVYVSLARSDRVAVIDVATNRVTENIRVTSDPLSQPTSVAATPDNRFVCVVRNPEGLVSVIDTVQNTVVPPDINVGAGAHFVRFGPPIAGGNLCNFYIARPATNTFSISPERAASRGLDTHSTGGTEPYCLAAAPDGRRLFVTNRRSHDISVIDLFTNRVISRVATGGRAPFGIAISPDSTLVYVANSSSGTLSVIDTRTMKEAIPPVAVGNTPWRIAMAPDGGRVYVANMSDNTVSVFDTRSGTVTNTITGFYTPVALAAAPVGDRLYVCNFNVGSVAVIDTRTLTPLASIRVGREPSAIAVTSDGTLVYVANSGDHTFSIIEAATGRVLGPIAVGREPAGIAVSPNGKEIRVANSGSNTVSCLSFTAPSTWTTWWTETLGDSPADVAAGTMWYGHPD